MKQQSGRFPPAKSTTRISSWRMHVLGSTRKCNRFCHLVFFFLFFCGASKLCRIKNSFRNISSINNTFTAPSANTEHKATKCFKYVFVFYLYARAIYLFVHFISLFCLFLKQAGMALYKIVPKNPYYFWSVMSLVMQVCRLVAQVSHDVHTV